MSRNFTAGHRPPPVPSGGGIAAKLKALLKAPASWSWKKRIGAVAVLLAALVGAAFATGNQHKIPMLDKIPMPSFGGGESEVADGGDGEADRADEKRGKAKARARSGKRSRRARKDRKLTAAQKKRRAERRKRRQRDND